MEPSPFITLILQVAIILALSRVMGMLFSRLNQPQVMGEIIAGIMLGPSLLRLYLPSVYDTFFPAASIETLQVVSQIGVIFFLFLIGLEFDPQLVKRRGRATLLISASSIITPFVIGVGLTFYLYPRIFNDPQRTHFVASALFMGAAISVTAFPVLARIIAERNLQRTAVGAISITAAAVNDVLAWCLLAVVVALAQFNSTNGPIAALTTIAMAGGFVAFMLFAMRPFLRRLQIVYDRQARLSQNLIAAIILLMLMSAYATERMGIHSLFGAFMMGCVMPKGTRFVRELSEKLQDFTVVVLLPVFFAYAGLRTDLTQIAAGAMWGYTAFIILAACTGKIGGSALAARFCGQSWRDALTIGTLMNTRGLMELIILTIGLSLGVINQTVYAMMVVMALVTTALTTPLLHLINRQRVLESARGPEPSAGRRFTVLIPISDPASGLPMLELAATIAGSSESAPRRLLALHLRRPVEREAYRAGLDETPANDDETLAPMISGAQRSGITVEPISFVSRDVPDDVASVARIHQANIVLIGFHRPVIGATILGGTVHRLLTNVESDVGIFVNRNFTTAKRILVPYLGSTHDRLAMELAGRIARSTGAKITVLHIVPPARGTDEQTMGAKKEVDRVFQEPDQAAPVTFRVIEDNNPVEAVLSEAKNADLVVIGVAEQWGLESQLFGWRPERIARECPTSLLIVRKHPREAAIAIKNPNISASSSAPTPDVV